MRPSSDITFVFKLYTYHNGLEETVIRAKEKVCFGVWRWVRVKDTLQSLFPYDDVYEAPSRQSCIDTLHSLCERRLDNALARIGDKRRKTLTLITIEETPITLSILPPPPPRETTPFESHSL